MNAAITEYAGSVAASDFSQWASGSAIAYPLANVVHLLGLVMLIGAIGIVDLRLAGVFRALPVAPLSRALTPVAIAGLVLMIPSGVTMFAADAAALADSAIFRWKLGLIGIALINAAAFRLVWRHHLGTWDRAPPRAGRIMAAGSILLWLTIGALGRMIAYS